MRGASDHGDDTRSADEAVQAASDSRGQRDGQASCLILQYEKAHAFGGRGRLVHPAFDTMRMCMGVGCVW